MENVTPKANEFWINKKNGQSYAIICIATESTNSREGSTSVVYKKEDKIYVRDLDEFILKFDKDTVNTVIKYYSGDSYLIPEDKVSQWDNSMALMCNLGGEAVDNYEYNFLANWEKCKIGL